MDSIPHLYNLLGPKSWEEMRLYANEKLIPAPLTPYSATAIGLVWMKREYAKSKPGTYFYYDTWVTSLITIKETENSGSDGRQVELESLHDGGANNCAVNNQCAV